MRLPDSRRLGFALGGTYLVFGVLEVITHRTDTTGAIAFWSLSLLGGGGLVVAGTVLRPDHRTAGLTLLTVGAIAGLNATLWTVLVPVLALVTLAAAYREDEASRTY